MKKIYTLFVVAVVFFTAFSTVDRYSEAKTLDEMKSEVEELLKQEEAAKLDIEKTNSNIAANQAAITKATNDIAAKEDQINASYDEISSLQGDIDQKDIEIQELLKYLQKNDLKDEELTFIFEAESVTDAIHREASGEKLTEKSNDMINEFLQLQEDLKVKIVQYEGEIDELEQLKVDFQKKIEELNITLGSLNDFKISVGDSLEDLNKEIKMYEDLKCKGDEELEQCLARVNAVPDVPNGFQSPLVNGVVTSWMGWRWGSYHTGTDISSYNKSEPVYASASGLVSAVGWDPIYRGNYVYIKHTVNGQQYTTIYCHMRYAPLVKVGDVVSSSTQIGVMGSTGASTGPHLHFEIVKGWFLGSYSGQSRALDTRNYIGYPGLGVPWTGRLH